MVGAAEKSAAQAGELLGKAKPLSEENVQELKKKVDRMRATVDAGEGIQEDVGTALTITGGAL